ncbi:hypothetical protein SAY87_006771 [Trapa incisa]|uniref:Ultraviolet-B-repressible protein n=1 Tax=Trapa incisa TaxID=236973 RepID=A0AAN7K1R0_9MYRT|nr:hypothetical protein SAY87_006771 [Trapa incisa]
MGKTMKEVGKPGLGRRKRHRQSSPQTIMASTSAVSMAMPLTAPSAQRKPTGCFLKSLPLRSSKKSSMAGTSSKFEVRASIKEKAVTALTAAAITASMVIPDAAEAAVSPSLKNFLLSIGAGGVVVGVIVVAVIGVANFDPVKRS